MDALGDLLRGVRADDAMVCQSIASPPWSLRYASEAPLTLLAVVRGSAWLMPNDGEPMPMRVGDVALVRGPQHFVVADRPDTAPMIAVFGQEHCTDEMDPRSDSIDQWRLGPRTYGHALDAETVLVTGVYDVQGTVSDRLLTVLPEVFVVPCDEPCPVLGLVSEEIARDSPGQQIVLDRLLDLLLVFTLRTWFGRPEANTPDWYRALSDPLVGPALKALHDDPARPWTVAGLASEVGLSRAALARRFTALVGEPPLSYLTAWRMALAADLLRQPQATVSSVGRAVGYADGFTFSTAFKRVRGVRPSEHRVVALHP